MKPATPSKLPIDNIDWGSLVPSVGAASRALAYYKGILRGIPSPTLFLSPLTLQEAVLSSRIEGTQATLDEVLRFEAGDEPSEPTRRIDIQEIINYRLATQTAVEALGSRPFNLNLLLELHGRLLDSVRGRNKARGQFRRVQNWIGAPGCLIEQADYVPPDPLVLLEYLDNWEKYYHSDRPDPLVQLAVVHAQFEIIHPFLDGNGRLGRILIPLFLYEKELLSQPVFYLSSYLEEHRDEYVGRLRALGSSPNSWNEWVAFFLTAVEIQAKRNAEKAERIKTLYEKLKVRVIDVTRSPYAVPVLDLLFKVPVLSSSRIHLPVDQQPSRATLFRLLRDLREAGMLKVLQEGSGRRSQILALWELIDLIEDKPTEPAPRTEPSGAATA
jgi:Fic family protein